jgi:hypothetical protein
MTSEHFCHARRCDIPVPPSQFACRRHWFMLPKRLRDRIWAMYRPGQEVTKDPSDAYLAAALEAVEYLDAKETTDAPPDWRWPGSPERRFVRRTWAGLSVESELVFAEAASRVGLDPGAVEAVAREDRDG